MCQLKYLVSCAWKIFEITKEIQLAKVFSLIYGLTGICFLLETMTGNKQCLRKDNTLSSFLMKEVKVVKAFILKYEELPWAIG